MLVHNFQPVALKSQTEDGETTYNGDLLEYDKRQENGYLYESGSLKESIDQLKSGRIPALYGHMQQTPIGDWSNFAISNKVLSADLTLDDELSFTSDAKRMIERGTLSGISIGTSPIAIKSGEDEEGRYTVYISKARLVEASLVLNPADPELSLSSLAGIRSGDGSINFESLELLLSRMGLTASEIKSHLVRAPVKQGSSPRISQRDVLNRLRNMEIKV